MDFYRFMTNLSGFVSDLTRFMRHFERFVSDLPFFVGDATAADLNSNNLASGSAELC
jgi:hypothetical protein